MAMVTGAAYTVWTAGTAATSWAVSSAVAVGSTTLGGISVIAGKVAAVASSVWATGTGAAAAVTVPSAATVGVVIAYTVTSVRIYTLLKKKYVDMEPLTRAETLELITAGLGIGAAVAGRIVAGGIALIDSSGTIVAKFAAGTEFVSNVGLGGMVAVRAMSEALDPNQRLDVAVLYLCTAVIGITASAGLSFGLDPFSRIMASEGVQGLAAMLIEAKELIKVLGFVKAREVSSDRLSDDITPQQARGVLPVIRNIYRKTPNTRQLSDKFTRRIPLYYRHDDPFYLYICPITRNPIRFIATLPGDPELYERAALLSEVDKPGGRFGTKFTRSDVIVDPALLPANARRIQKEIIRGIRFVVQKNENQRIQWGHAIGRLTRIAQMADPQPAPASTTRGRVVAAGSGVGADAGARLNPV